MTTVVPPRAQRWLLAHPAAPAKEAAAALNLSISSVRTYRWKLIRAGLLDRRGMAAKLRATRDAIRDGHTWESAARHLGVHPQTVTWRLARLDLGVDGARRQHVYSGMEWAAIFGYAPESEGSYKALRRWQAAGLVTNNPAPGRPWRITAEALMAFLEDARSWPLVKIRRIADPDWKRYAEQARAGQWIPQRRKRTKEAA